MSNKQAMREQWFKEHPNATGDIGIDISEEDEKIFDKVYAELPQMTEEERAAEFDLLSDCLQDVQNTKNGFLARTP